MSDAASIGHNQPPTDQEVFIQRLEDTYPQLTDRYADLEAMRRKLPKEVKTQADVDAITAYSVECAKLDRETERTRVMVKEPYLERGKWIDGWFGDIRRLVQANADAATQRANAWLQAKRRAEEAERAAAAARAREEAAKAQREAQAAREAEIAAQRAREEAEEALRKGAPEPQGENIVAFVVADEEKRLRDAYEAEQHAKREAEEAAKAARIADFEAEQAQEHAEAPAPLARASTVGGSLKVKESWSPRIVSLAALRQSLGAAGPYFLERELGVMLDRAAKAPGPPIISGVEWIPQQSVKTTLSRARKGQENATE